MRNILLTFVLFLLTGVLLTVFAYLGWLTPFFLSATFCIILLLFVYCIAILFSKLHLLSKLELVLIYLFVCIWSMHFLQVLVPETGFDALWYHLPVAQGLLYAKGLVYLPQLYQSVNPQFADLYFLAGFSVFGIFGAKLIAYIFASFLAVATYYLSRLFVPRQFAILIALIISTFQVIAWQSASFYIDVAKAFFEIAGLLFIFLDKDFYKKVGLLFFAASLATKLFSLLLVPVFIFSFGIQKFFSRKFGVYFLLLFGVPLLYYWFAYTHIGNPFYSLIVHTEKLQEIGGQANPFLFTLLKLSTLPRSLYFFMTARDYVNPILILLLIPIFMKIRTVWQDKKLRTLLIFSLAQWCVWWFIPPLSTRYAISGFITMFILGTAIITHEYTKNQKNKNQFMLVLLFFTLLAVVPRTIVARRSLQYILTNQTRQNYLQQFYDGSIDEKINSWYGY
ncbi:hypothetical protein KA017_02380 [Candidatus Woesebacteria bacterium]|nr:hypothetical protein [Candidatus Woesebacteria bacterium]